MLKLWMMEVAALLALAGTAGAQESNPLQITCPPNLTNWVCGADSSAFVNYPLPTTTGSCPTPATVTCTPPSGSAFIPGTTTVTCRAVNSCRESATCSFTVTVAHDTVLPVIQCPTNFTVWTCSPTGAVVNFPAPAATDNLDATPTVVCSPPSGSVFPLGPRVVTCAATDDCTNRSSCTFTVTVRPPLLYDGLCHSPLGAAGLNVNTNAELEVSGLGRSGQDGVRIDLGESQGLHWSMDLPSSEDADGRDFLIWQRQLGSSTAGTEILLGQMLYASRNGRRSVTLDAASFEVKLLLRGEVVYQQGGQTGDVEIPPCHHVTQDDCTELDVPDFIHIHWCIDFLAVECDWETPLGPIRADTLVLTPEDPLPPFTAVSAVEILGSNLPVLALHTERLLMFGGREQPPRPHRALGQARLVAENGTLTMADLGSSRGGVAIVIAAGNDSQANSEGVKGYSAELYVGDRMEAGAEFQITAHTFSGTNQDSSLGTVTLSQVSAISAELHTTPIQGGWFIPLLVVAKLGEPVGGATLAGSGPLATMSPVGAQLPSLIGVAKLPSHPLGFQLRFDGLAVFTLRDGTRLTGDEIRVLADRTTPGNTDLASLELSSIGLKSFTIISERPLTRLDLACPPGLTLRTCSTNPVPVSFPPHVVGLGNCTLPASVICVPPDGSLFPPGVTTVHCTATNACLESAVCSFAVTVLADIVPPAIQCPTNVSAFTANAAGRVVNFGPPMVTDDPAANVSCTPAPASLFPVGVTPVVCTARDACGHERSCTFTVEVTLLTLRLASGASGPILSWTGDAILEAADEITGPWLPIRAASSPYLVQFVGAKRFFRLSQASADACGEVALNPTKWDIDVPGAQIQGAFLLNGRPFPSSFLHGANFFLRNATSGDEVYLGLSNDQSYDRRVVPGRYDVVYEHKIGRDVPLNSQAVLHAGLEISGDLVFNIDVPAVGVGGAFMFNGAPAPVTPVESGRIQARDRQNGALTLLGQTSEQTYSALLIPGAYDLMYSAIAGGAVAPANHLTAFRRNVSILGNGVVNIDVPVIHVTGAFTVNGAPTPVTPTDNGRIYLLDPDTGASLLLGETIVQVYDRLLIPGTYDFRYERLAGGGVMPANSGARFLTGVSLQADGAFNINLPVAQISGAFRVNGAPAPNTGTENALITLRQGEDTVTLGQTAVGAFQVLVLHGTYQTTFRGLAGGAVMPANTNAVLGSVVIAGASVFDIDIPAVTFAADVLFNGGDFPGPIAGESARLYLEDTLTNGRIFLGTYPAFDQVSRRVVRGTYVVRYEYESGTTLPRNAFATLGPSLSVTQNVQTVIDVRAVALSGDFRLNGGVFPGGQNAAVTLRSLQPGDSLYLGGTQDGAYATVIVPGHYAAHYNWAQGSLIPRNQNARLTCPR